MGEVINLDYLREILEYDPYTGVFIWNRRPRTDFAKASLMKAWNNKHQGQEAGQIDWGTGKIKISLKGGTYSLDKIAWFLYYGTFPPAKVYHSNGQQADNRISNLTKEKGGKPAKYNSGLICLEELEMPSDEGTYYSYYCIYELKEHVEGFHPNYVFSYHLHLRAARQRLLEIADVLQADWDDLTRD